MSDWIKWDGGICPVDVETEVEYRLRYFAPGAEPFRCKAGLCRWDHGRTPESAADLGRRQNDIVAYLVASS